MQYQKLDTPKKQVKWGSQKMHTQFAGVIYIHNLEEWEDNITLW
jgi:hypothetical protein